MSTETEPEAVAALTGTLRYSSNNSGGDWWLTDDHWLALEAAGWVVAWQKDNDSPYFGGGDRWLGALATEATLSTDDPDAALAEWSLITGQDPAEEGCNCCGNPHMFTFTDRDGNSRFSSAEVTGTRLVWS